MAFIDKDVVDAHSMKINAIILFSPSFSFKASKLALRFFCRFSKPFCNLLLLSAIPLSSNTFKERSTS